MRTTVDAATREVLAEDVWRARARRHEERVDALVAPHLARRQDGVKHPVHDFLFTYYSQRPAQLRRWHPGLGVALEGADEYDGRKGYTVTAGTAEVSPEYAASRRPLADATYRLLTATAGRSPQLGCFGLHEWAMVHRLSEDATRHPDHPLRLGPAGTDAVVESHRITCTHFDAFRFFTPSARPLNTLSPGPDDRPAHEQPGCLHATMDLYKHAFRLTPLVPSELVADCFALALEVRVVDMRASPYDLADLGVEPIRIETVEGKQEYAAAQRAFAERAAPLRERLRQWSQRVAAATSSGVAPSNSAISDSRTAT